MENEALLHRIELLERVLALLAVETANRSLIAAALDELPDSDRRRLAIPISGLTDKMADARARQERKNLGMS